MSGADPYAFGDPNAAERMRQYDNLPSELRQAIATADVESTVIDDALFLYFQMGASMAIAYIALKAKSQEGTANETEQDECARRTRWRVALQATQQAALRTLPEPYAPRPGSGVKG